MSNKKPPTGTTSFWMALLAIAISLIGTGVSIIEAGILHDQQQLMMEEKAASVWPFVSGQTIVREGAAGPEAVFTLTNKGVGPALINSLSFSAGAVSGSIHDVMGELDLADNNFNVITILSQPVSGTVLAAGETLEVYKLLLIDKNQPPASTDEVEKVRKISRMQASSLILDQISKNYCYCSVYGDCWDTYNQPLKASETCSGREMLRKPE